VCKTCFWKLFRGARQRSGEPTREVFSIRRCSRQRTQKMQHPHNIIHNVAYNIKETVGKYRKVFVARNSWATKRTDKILSLMKENISGLHRFRKHDDQHAGFWPWKPSGATRALCSIQALKPSGRADRNIYLIDGRNNLDSGHGSSGLAWARSADCGLRAESQTFAFFRSSVIAIGS
jgi:hypothetical protein